ncbi:MULTISPECIES: bifunctional lysylphosphatidylglycerol synthetase/lysine--tRNA ligase LysX [Trueperella]|uniref:Lysine--tRNA ligase n=1 Tax=Trueperella abortisuis TaxID=445930 RepID=A0ABT9PG22_9ACTO|nr:MULTISPECIES: bifunctional lysylphosphatidylglycerol synthetase/lysine--tRNA ligase LysX [Trueperella]MDP9831671.1 lysyl-tRNA synthetase class 2 [Trueperella abortisuis]MDY5403953.1 bifunctional lysylphosphatidylglycerol synthetase/lysine--tRNA ligase LysX [Trueperella sp.]
MHTSMDMDSPCQPASAGQEAVARFFTFLLQVVATWNIVGLLVERVAPGVADAISEVFWLTNISADPSLIWGLVNGLLASGFMRRQRAAMISFVVIFQASTIALAVPLIPMWEDFVDVGAGEEQLSFYLFLGGTAFALVSVILLLWSLPAFPARLARGAWLRALAVGIGGAAIGYIYAYLSAVMAHHMPYLAAAKWAAAAVVNADPTSSPYNVAYDAGWLTYLIAEVIVVASLLGAISTFFRADARQVARQVDSEVAARTMLLHDDDADSLSYFATRDDRRLTTSPNGRAAISWKVTNGVALAGGDPLGDRQSWAEAITTWKLVARRHGWVPAVISASEDGARAYQDAGMHLIAMGDESVIYPGDFSLSKNKPVRRAIAGPRNAGYTVRIRRQEDIDADELAELAACADRWRVGEERGFSMALGRLGDPRDPRILVVTAHDAAGEVRSLLTFVPWGRRGVSLDFMRRSPNAASGVNELMMTELMQNAENLAIDRISLNFAMFRSAFEVSERVGASPLQRLNYRVLMIASRWWQLHSLYESNAKYNPVWKRRLMCYSSAQQLTRTLIACGRAEGFVPDVPQAFRRRNAVSVSETYVNDVVARMQPIIEGILNPSAIEPKRNEQQRVRIAKLKTLEGAGMDPYPPAVPHTASIAQIKRGADGAADAGEASIVGRILRIRDHGGIIFADLREGTDELQISLERSGTADMKLWRAGVDRGDVVSVTGRLGASRTGEPTFAVDAWVMAAKSLVAPPDKFLGVADPEARLRNRHMYLATDAGAWNRLYTRSAAVKAVRDFLAGRDYIEVETPILQRVHGGANARPFATHINAYDLNLTMRIAPELFLKRLCVAGVERVFELGRNFRNEGADATHNPEFTSLEAYEAYGDYLSMRELTRELIIAAATAVHGSPRVPRPGGGWLDISGPWRSITVHDAVSEACGQRITAETGAEELRALCKKFDIEVGAHATAGAMVTELYDELVESQTEEPTFYLDFPVETSPLTAPHRSVPGLAERWDLVAFGMELGTAYTELTDPLDQRDRLTRQSLLAAAGDAEAMEVDEEFLSALEFGMRPTGGLGIGIDRLTMFLVDGTIRDTLAFPFVKPAAQ